jgi:hypothetical protein
MSVTIKTVAPWCFVVAILIMAIGVAFPLFRASKTKAGIDMLENFSRLLCNDRLAQGTYPDYYPVEAADRDLFRQFDYRTTGINDFIIEAEVPSLFWRDLRLKAVPEGVFSYSRQRQAWVLEAAPDSRCQELSHPGARR